MKRVFILGAGFSHDAGLPLASKLTSKLLKNLQLADEDQEELVSLHGLLGPSASPEQLADAVRQYAILERVRAQGYQRQRAICIVPNEHEWLESESEHHSNVEAERSTIEMAASWWEREVPRLLEEQLMKTILEHSPAEVPDYVTRFVSSLSDGDCIISFNYDTLVELALESAGVRLDLGFQLAGPGNLRLLKLHGSIDWFVHRYEQELLSDFQLLHDAPTHVHAGHAGWRLVRAWVQKDLNTRIVASNSGSGNFAPAFPGFGTFKSIGHVPGLHLVWKNALQALGDTDEVYVLGYSLPPTDMLVRLAFSEVFAGRKHGLSRLIVVDPNEGLDREAFTRVFRCWVDHRDLRTEHVNWNALLDL